MNKRRSFYYSGFALDLVSTTFCLFFRIYLCENNWWFIRG